MTLQFPSSPSNNDVYENYIYNSTAGAWQKLPGNTFADAAISDTPPVNPNNGDLWWSNDLTTGNKLSVYNGSSFVNTAPISNNAIINGDFGIWQRGTSFAGASVETYSADRFYFDRINGGAVTREAFAPADIEAIGYGDAQFFGRASGIGDENNQIFFGQKIEDVRTFAGQQVTVSFWAKSASEMAYRVALAQNFGSGGSANTSQSEDITITTSWQRFSFTKTLQSVSGKTIGSDSSLILNFRRVAADAFTLDVWGVQLEAGSVATPFRLAGGGSKAAELALCHRYYYKYTNVREHNINGFVQSAAQKIIDAPFPVPMRQEPLVTTYDGLENPGKITEVSSNGTPTNNATPALVLQNTRAARVYITSASPGFNFSIEADAEL